MHEEKESKMEFERRAEKPTPFFGSTPPRFCHICRRQRTLQTAMQLLSNLIPIRLETRTSIGSLAV